MSTEEIKKQLQDPLAVHVNMLRGTIAKPTDEQIKSLYPHLFQQWIPIEKELPDIDQIVWLYNNNTGLVWSGGRAEYENDDEDMIWLWGNTYGSFWHNGERWAGDIDLDNYFQPTHWRPFPEVPVKEEA